jgi:serine/threonine protein kinase
MMNHQAIEVGAKVGNYKLEQKLGKGSFAEVFKARDLSNKSAVALKMMDIEDLKRKNGKVQDYVRGELKAMLEFSRYKNFIKMIEEFQYKQYKVLVLEFCEGGDVRQLLKEKGSLPEAIVQNFAIQMTNGIKCMQEKKYVHRDLKVIFGKNVYSDYD